jgi:heme a synthase
MDVTDRMSDAAAVERTAVGTPAPADWRAQFDARQRRYLRTWLWSGAVLTFVILVIGGITRLTQSGLSIVDWNPIMGVVPPLTEAQWQEAFDRYRQFPEYQQLRRGMTLDEFQFIFFWEYLHRMVARTIGLVFLVPFLVFWARGYLARPMMRRSLVLFGLGAAQGFMGWFMVASGLVDVPHVSHYRLAAHLGIAFAIFGCCVWFAMDLKPRAPGATQGGQAHRRTLTGIYAVGVLLGVQVFWGALVAGLKAGFMFNTFPLMAGGLLPPHGLNIDPAWKNVLENPATVQWMHRVLGTLLLLAAVAVLVRARAAVSDARARVLAGSFVAMLAAQYGLGVATLVMNVPVSLGVAHQAVAMVLFGVWLAWLHRVRGLPVEAVGAPASGR